jgi:2-polyprenyl-3-methyl-5-hydroxy-6-metoxy-1,4-benzoquinol methylase
MIKASDQVTKHAYSRMRVDSSHKWALHATPEAKYIADSCKLSPGLSVLDLGCGSGRHVLELAALGMNVTGVDYLGESFSEAHERAERQHLVGVRFIEGDARKIDLQEDYDAVICLYDVIGSYAENTENMLILLNCARHLKPGGLLLLSVMNFELTEYQAKQFFSLTGEPKKLADLEPSQTMETTGNVFNPDFYMIDRKTEVVYRKEQFAEGNKLPTQLVVRDRRYRRSEIEAMCEESELEVIWSRFVQAGNWENGLDAQDQHAKEILVLCGKPEHGTLIRPHLEELSKPRLEKRYVWRVASALKWGFADFDDVGVTADRDTLNPEDLATVLDLLRLRPIQFCIFLKALVGAEEMKNIMLKAISFAGRQS